MNIPRRWGLTLLAFLLAVPSLQAQIQQGTATCTVVIGMLNHDRFVIAPNQGVHISAECPEDIHSAPWGNWGVSSNAGTKEDGDQFQGWKCGDKCQWNSCTSVFPPPNCTYYNDASCTQQVSITGNME